MTDQDLLERLANIEGKLEGVTRLEEQLANFARTWESLSDLGRDLSHLMDPAVKNLTEGMLEVEIGFQLEDLITLVKKGLLSLKYITWALEALENFVDWWKDMEPLMKIAVPRIIDFMDDLEQGGYFQVNAAIRKTYTKVAAHYTPEDIETISDGYVLAHGIVKKLANPRLMPFFEKLIDLPLTVNLEESKPVGPMGLLVKMRSEECRQGLGVLVELTQALGQLKMKLAQTS